MFYRQQVSPFPREKLERVHLNKEFSFLHLFFLFISPCYSLSLSERDEVSDYIIISFPLKIQVQQFVSDNQFLNETNFSQLHKDYSGLQSHS